MARRVTWTNNSTDYDGANIYRDTTIDPQNLPEPIATVGPVAQGETVEYVNTDELQDGDYCYAVRDFDGSSESTLSDSYCITIGGGSLGFDTSYNANLAYTNDDRTADETAGNWEIGRADPVTDKTTGKWYFEYVLDRLATNAGISIDNGNSSVFPGFTNDTGTSYLSNGRLYANGSFDNVDTYGVGDVIGCAVDFDAMEVIYQKNGVDVAPAEPFTASGSLHAAVSLIDAQCTIALTSSDQTFTPPSGYTAIGESA